MAKFVYVGDGEKGEGPDAIVLFGRTFSKNGEPVEVIGKEAKKLATNRHFAEHTASPAKSAKSAKSADDKDAA